MRSFTNQQISDYLGITPRQLTYLAEKGIVTPSVRDAYGSGSQRSYSYEDISRIVLVIALRGIGVEHSRLKGALDRWDLPIWDENRQEFIVLLTSEHAEVNVVVNRHALADEINSVREGFSRRWR